MSTRTLALHDALHAYLLRVSLREPALFRRLREETAALPQAKMQISPEQGQFMGMLVRLLGVKRAIEVGVFTGYSGMCVAGAMPADGRLAAFDVSPDWTAIARRYWKEAGVADKIDLKIGPAADGLRALIAAGQSGTYDFAFIDADKSNYDTYYELCLVLLRHGGLMTIDNVLWGGKVADGTVNDPETVTMRALNKKIHADARVDLSLVPIGDGLTLARKR